MRCSLGEYLQDVSVRFSLLTFGLVKRLRLCLVKMLSLGRMHKKVEKYVFLPRSFYILSVLNLFVSDVGMKLHCNISSFLADRSRRVDDLENSSSHGLRKKRCQPEAVLSLSYEPGRHQQRAGTVQSCRRTATRSQAGNMPEA